MQLNQAPNGETRIIRLFHEYQAVKAGLNEQSPDAEEEHVAIYEEMDAIEKKIVALPCTCAADFAAEVILDTVNGGLFSDWKLGSLWKEARELVGMPFLGLESDDMREVRDRLQSFARWTGTCPPQELLDKRHAPTSALLHYCRTEGLSLDWLFLGDVQSLVMERHRQSKEKACA